MFYKWTIYLKYNTIYIIIIINDHNNSNNSNNKTIIKYCIVSKINNYLQNLNLLKLQHFIIIDSNDIYLFIHLKYKTIYCIIVIKKYCVVYNINICII